MKPKADPTDTYASPAALARTPEELLESMTGMFLPPSAMGEVNGLKILCLQRENTALKAEVKRLRSIANRAISALVIVTYGEATIDFEWPDIMRKVGELRNEFPFLGSTTEESSAPQL